MMLPHLDGAYNLARYLTRDPVLSDDIVQDAFLRAVRAFPDFRGGSSRAWLLTIVRNCCRSTMAARSASAVHAVYEANLSDAQLQEFHDRADDTDNAEQALIRTMDAEEVRMAVQALPEPYREALVLRELEELSYKEIAEVTGVAIGTVMSRLARARSLLAPRLAGTGSHADDESRSSDDARLR
jgi:RNA polymerase sigma-70 factor (ECF subfamily)